MLNGKKINFKKHILLLLFFSLIINQEKMEYKIHMIGIPAAKCIYTLSDTTFHDKTAFKINYKVESFGLYGLFFKVKNNYNVIFEKNTFKILYYSKDSTQPGLDNQISTIYNTIFDLGM